MWRFFKRMKDRNRLRKGLIDEVFHPIFEPYQGQEVVSLDCETTSLDTREAEIVSIAAVIVSKNRIFAARCFDVRVQAPKSLSSDSIKIHKLRAIDLEGGLPLLTCLRELLEFVGNRPIIGYYLSYDIAILERYMRQSFGFGFPNKLIEISQFYARKSRQPFGAAAHDLRLDTILHQLKLPFLPRHNALDDAITVGLIYIRLSNT